MTESSAESSTELFSETSEMVPNGLNIPMYELLGILSNIFQVRRFSGKHGIYLKPSETVPNCSIWFQTADR